MLAHPSGRGGIDYVMRTLPRALMALFFIVLMVAACGPKTASNTPSGSAPVASSGATSGASPLGEAFGRAQAEFEAEGASCARDVSGIVCEWSDAAEAQYTVSLSGGGQFDQLTSADVAVEAAPGEEIDKAAAADTILGLVGVMAPPARGQLTTWLAANLEQPAATMEFPGLMVDLTNTPADDTAGETLRVSLEVGV